VEREGMNERLKWWDCRGQSERRTRAPRQLTRLDDGAVDERSVGGRVCDVETGSLLHLHALGNGDEGVEGD
jgi:hypothetical protein